MKTLHPVILEYFIVILVDNLSVVHSDRHCSRMHDMYKISDSSDTKMNL